MEIDRHIFKYRNFVAKFLANENSIPKHKVYEYLWAIRKKYILWNDLSPNAEELFDVPNSMDYGIDLISEDFKECAQVKLYDKSSITWNDYSKFYTYAKSFIKCDNLHLLTTKTAKISKHALCSIKKENINFERIDFDELIPDDLEMIKEEENSITEIEQRDYLVECSSLFRNGEKDFFKFQLPCGMGKTFIVYDIIKKSNGKHIIFTPWIILAEQIEKECSQLDIKTSLLGDRRTIVKSDFELLICVYPSVDKIPNIEFKYKFIDEAHHIENSDSIFRNKIFEIKSEKTLCLSATYHNQENLDFILTLRDGIEKNYLTDYVLNIEYYSSLNKDYALMKTIKENIDWSPMFIYFNNIDKAIKYAKELRKMNINATHLESKDGKEKRRSIKENVLNRTIDVVCLCGIYNEGVSISNLQTVIFGDLRFSDINKIQVSMRGSRKHPTKPFYRIVLPLVEKDFEENDVKNLVKCWYKIDPKIKESIERGSVTRIKVKKDNSYDEGEFIKEEIFNRFGEMLKGLSIEEKINEFLKIVEEKGIPPQNGTILFSDFTCCGTFWGNCKSKEKLETNEYSELLKNEILKKDYDLFLQKRKEEKVVLTTEEKVNEFIDKVNEINTIPSQGFKHLFSDKTCMGKYWSRTKLNHKFETKPYDKLLTLKILKDDYTNFKKLQEENKNVIGMKEEEKISEFLLKVNELGKIPSQTSNILFTNGKDMSRFWRSCKETQKLNEKLYSSLLENSLLKNDYENYLKINSKNKSKEKVSIEDKITLFIEEVNKLQKIPTNNKTSLFSDGICMGNWYSKMKLSDKFENEPYNELLKNEIIKENINDYLKTKNKNKLKFEEKIQKLLEFVEKYQRLPVINKEDVFSDNSSIGRFWSDVKINNKVQKKPYDILLSNELLNKNYQQYQKN